MLKKAARIHNIKPEPEITCPLFFGKEGYIKELTGRVNRTGNIGQKARLAQVLANKVESFLSCVHYDENNLKCKDCRSISQMWSKIAELMIRAAKAGVKLRITALPK